MDAGSPLSLCPPHSTLFPFLQPLQESTVFSSGNAYIQTVARARALSLYTHTHLTGTLLLVSCIPLQLWQKEGRDEEGFRLLPWESTLKDERERHTARGLCFTSNATLFGGAVDVERDVEREARERAKDPLKRAEVSHTASQLLKAIVSSHMHARSGK
jgi:hypothetical protein